MIKQESSGELIAVSYESSMFNNLVWFCQQHSRTLHRISPEDFFSSRDTSGCYINLVTLDMELRKKISHELDIRQLKRFSYVHENCVNLGSIGPGCFFCPFITLGTYTKIEKDVISMGQSSIGHNSIIGQGTVMSPSVTISGSVKIGNFCKINTRATVLDHLSIADEVHITAGSMVRKNITESGHYLVNSRGTLVKL